MTVKEFSAAPQPSALYPKAVLGGLRKGGGNALPDTQYLCSGVVARPARVADYNRVCGFRLTDELPGTYPHVLAFGLQLALMTEPDFPFPLLGMVHVANRITQLRPVRLEETFALRVRAQNLRPHQKGTQFDVVSELVPEGESAPVWTDTSTYLRKGGDWGDSGATEGKAESSLAPPSPSALWRVPGDIGRRYAAVSGDRNPIHLHRLAARLFGFRAAIAHGMWTKARCLAAFEGRLPSAYTADVRFKVPISLPATVAFTAWDDTDGGDPDGRTFELWDARKPKPHLRGRIEGVR
jgi:acyl dehydratase